MVCSGAEQDGSRHKTPARVETEGHPAERKSYGEHVKRRMRSNGCLRGINCNNIGVKTSHEEEMSGKSGVGGERMGRRE